MAAPDPPAPPPDVWEGVDELLADSRNLRLLDVADVGPPEPHPTQQLRSHHATALPQQAPQQQASQQQQQQHQNSLFPHRSSPGQQQLQQQQQQQNRTAAAAQGPVQHTVQLQHKLQQQQQLPPQHFQQHPLQQHPQQSKWQHPQHYPQQQHPTPVLASPPAAPAALSRPSAASGSSDPVAWTVPPQQPQPPQPSHPRLLGSMSGCDMPQPGGGAGSLSGPVIRALEVSRFSASCRINSPCSSQQGVPQMTALGPPSSSGPLGSNISGCGGGGGTSLFSCGSERPLDPHECGPPATVAPPFSGVVTVPGWGVPQDLEVHMDATQPRAAAAAKTAAPPANLQQYYRTLTTPAAHFPLQQPAATQVGSQQGTSWPAHAAGPHAAAAGQLLGTNTNPAAGGSSAVSGTGCRVGVAPYGEPPAMAGMVEEVAYGVAAGVGDGRGGFGVAVAPTKLLRRSSPPTADGSSAQHLSRTLSGVVSQPLSVGSGTIARMTPDAFAMQQHQQHPPQPPPSQHQHTQQGQQQQQPQPHWQAQQQQQQQQHQQLYAQQQPQQQQKLMQQRHQHQQQGQFYSPPAYQLQSQPSQGFSAQQPWMQGSQPTSLPHHHTHNHAHTYYHHNYQQFPEAYDFPQPHLQQQLPKEQTAATPAPTASQSQFQPQPPFTRQASPQPLTLPPSDNNNNNNYNNNPRVDLRRQLLSSGSVTGLSQLDVPQTPSSYAGGPCSSESGFGSGAGGAAAAALPPPEQDVADAPAAATAGLAGWASGEGLGGDEAQTSASTGGSGQDEMETSQMGRASAPSPGVTRLLRAASLSTSTSGPAAAGGTAATAAREAAAAAASLPVSKALQRAAAAAAAREAAGATKAGRPRQRTRTCSTLADVIRFNLIPPGPHQLLVGNQDTVDVTVHSDGHIECTFGEFRSVSSLALAVLRQRNPNRMACDGWQEVRLNGVRLDELRQEAVRLLAQESAAAGGASSSVKGE